MSICLVIKTYALTSEAGSHEYTGETAKTAHERCSWYMPIPRPDVLVRLVSSRIHDDTKDDEDDDGDDLEGGKPVFCER